MKYFSGIYLEGNAPLQLFCGGNAGVPLPECSPQTN